MNFLTRFFRLFADSPAEAGSHSGRVSPDAILSVFLSSKSYIRGNTVHSSAFMPRNGELSLFQTQALPEHEIWQLAMDNVIQPGRSLYGRGDATPQAYHDAGLELVPDNTPPRHVNAVGWPVGEAAKDAQKEIALLLAQQARLIRCDPPIQKPAT